MSLKPVRIGLWDRYGGSMPSGWTRWLLEQFEFPFQVVYPPDLDKGSLREKFDVIILVDGAIPAPRFRAAIRPGTFTGDQPPDEETLPAEYRGRRGSITTTKTVPELRKFLEAGGTILTIGSSTALAAQLGLPVANHLADKGRPGQAAARGRNFTCLARCCGRAWTRPTRWPGAWATRWMSSSRRARPSGCPTPTQNAEARGLVRQASPRLRSGWAWGQEYLDGGVAIAEAKVGQGQLVLFGPEILFRGQPHGTFKFLFNGIVLAGVKE